MNKFMVLKQCLEDVEENGVEINSEGLQKLRDVADEMKAKGQFNSTELIQFVFREGARAGATASLQKFYNRKV